MHRSSFIVHRSFAPTDSTSHAGAPWRSKALLAVYAAIQIDLKQSILLAALVRGCMYILHGCFLFWDQNSSYGLDTTLRTTLRTGNQQASSQQARWAGTGWKTEWPSLHSKVKQASKVHIVVCDRETEIEIIESQWCFCCTWAESGLFIIHFLQKPSSQLLEWNLLRCRDVS